MIRIMREKFGPVTIGLLIGGIALVFIFFGVYSPKGTSPDGGPGLAGTVNGEAILGTTFKRQYDQRLEFFKNMGGSGLSAEQIKMFRIAESVFDELATKKLMVLEAEKTGFLPSDAEIRNKILEIPAFQKDGRFDKLRYKQVLEANQWSVGEFEKLIRDDVVAEKWRSYFKELGKPSKQEIDLEIEFAKDQRIIEYVQLHSEIPTLVAEEELKKFYSDPVKSDLVKAKYESAKESEYKGKKFEEIKDSIAKELIQAQKNKDALNQMDSLSENVRATLSKGEAATQALLKNRKTSKFIRSQPINRKTDFLPGVGEIKDLMKDAFSSPTGSAAKVYRVSTGILVARAVPVSEKTAPKKASPADERATIESQLENQNASALYEAWLKKLKEKAKIQMNDWVKQMSQS